MSTILILLIVLVALYIFGGAWNDHRFSPLGVVILVLLILLLLSRFGGLKL